jgi:PAT family beta-lactamase induction signal transducer AmpG
MMLLKNTLINKRLLAILMLGFASGLPLALVSSTLQAWFTEANISVVTIGTLSLIGLPYTFKFLWAPVMDHFQIPFLGKRRGFILITQAGMIVTLMCLANLNPALHTHTMAVVALIVAFFSASQDVSITAYQTDILKPEERGLGVAYYIFTYRVAALISGGLALILAAYIGFKATYNIMAASLLLCMIGTYFMPKPTELPAASHLYETIKDAAVDLFSREKIILILLFVLLYKAGDAFALQLMTNFLLHGLGFTLVEVGIAYKVVSFIATILGAFIGGFIMTRWSIYRALLWFGLAQAFSNFMFVIMAMVGKQYALMVSSIFIENFCSGLSTAALMAFLMSLCHHRYTASQFALLSAISALPRILLGPAAGVMVQALGWVDFYTAAFLLSFPALVFLLMLNTEVTSYALTSVD